MADVSKINGYNIKDSKARTDIADAIRYGNFHDDYVETHTFDDGRLANLSLNGHNHDDRYYTESEVDSQLGGKVDKVSGKGLSSNDYTTADKNTLSAIASGYRTIFVSTAEPTSADGNDGDIWIKYEV